MSEPLSTPPLWSGFIVEQFWTLLVGNLVFCSIRSKPVLFYSWALALFPRKSASICCQTHLPDLVGNDMFADSDPLT
jgi:hypothetical protein